MMNIIWKKMNKLKNAKLQQENKRFQEVKTMKRSNGEFDQISYQNKYIKEKYDRINLIVPKGRKEEIKKKALAEGKSVNEYINSLIDNNLKRAGAL